MTTQTQTPNQNNARPEGRPAMTRRLPALLTLAAVLAAPAARAQDSRDMSKAVEFYNAGEYPDAALKFFDLAENSGEPELQYRAEYFLALTYAKLGLHHSALYYDKVIIDQGDKHPYYLKAIEHTLQVMDAVGDKVLIPSLLDQQYGDKFEDLPADVLARINFLVGQQLALNPRKASEAPGYLEVVEASASEYPRALYVLAVQSTAQADAYEKRNDPEKADAKKADAAAKFQKILDLKDTEKVKYAELARLQELSLIALARVQYGQGKYTEAAATFARVKRFSRHWRDALFEGAYSNFMESYTGSSTAGFGRALGLLHTLHASAVGDQWVPESWLLKALTYYFQCLFPESKAAITELKERHGKVAEAVKALRDEKRPPEFWFELVEKGEAEGVKLPAGFRAMLLAEDRIKGYRAYAAAVAKELVALDAVERWRRSDMVDVLKQSVQQQVGLLRTTAGKALDRAAGSLLLAYDDIDANAEIVLFEMAKKEKDLLEAGHDESKVLASQTLKRPRVPGKGAEYWPFDGEFWPDELGQYVYTVKNACPAEPAQK